MEKLIVPVYLNQRLVFDLLAMLQGGISTVTAVTKTESGNTSDALKGKASLGLNGVLSHLLKIGLSAEKEKQSSTGQGHSISEERVHTPASLFYQLRNDLLSKHLLIQIDEETHPLAGDLVEFEASLTRNPIVETIESLSAMMNMAILFDDSPPVPSKSNGNKQNPPSASQKIKQQMDDFAASLRMGNTIDLTTSKLKSSHEAVITLETEYLNDPMMSDLVDGKFRVLGKVIRSIKEGEAPISLIRKTALSKLPEHALMLTFGPLSALASQQSFDMPELRWNIVGPAIQVLPVAIYA